VIKKLVLSLAAVACFGAEFGFNKEIISKYEWSLKDEIQKRHFVFNHDGSGKYKSAVDMSRTVGTVVWKVENGLLYVSSKPTISALPFSNKPFGADAAPVVDIAQYTTNIYRLEGITENKQCYKVVDNSNRAGLLCIDKYGI